MTNTHDSATDTATDRATDSASAALAPCSDMTRTAADDPVGSGTDFRTFLLLDDRGPWGRDAADDAIRELLSPRGGAAAHAQSGLRTFAVRPVMSRRSSASIPARAGRVGHRALLTELAELPDEAAVTSIAAGAPPGAPTRDVLIGVCTNSRRDRCCAVRGRPVATALHAEFGDHITEISHLGGHRFAATLLVLPTGYSYGFLDPAAARAVVAAALDGLVHPANLRGRADLTGPGQAADAHWRAGIGPAPLDDVRIVSEHSDGDNALVEGTVQGTADRVTVRRLAGPTIAVTACGGKPIHTGRWVVSPR